MFSLAPWKKTRDIAVRREDDNNPMVQFRREFDDLWNRFWGDQNRDLGLWGGVSRLGLSSGLEDQEREYVVRAELPGFEPEEIDLKVSGNVLTVSAERKAEEKKGNGSSYRYGRFHESFALPHGVVADEIDARYHNGVLEVHLPKSEEVKSKRIAVKSA